jgi:hypothetical protein
MDNSKSYKDELDILILDSISINNESIDLIELLSEELESGFSLNFSRQNCLAH